MNVSLDQAIDMYARALRGRSGHRGVQIARERAQRCADAGDLDGHSVWRRVAVVVEAFLSDETSVGSLRPNTSIQRLKRFATARDAAPRE